MNVPKLTHPEKLAFINKTLKANPIATAAAFAFLWGYIGNYEKGGQRNV